MIITRTPLRISLLGGGTDFPDFIEAEGGAVLSFAIDKYMYVCINKAYGDKVRVAYSLTENVAHARFVKHSLIRAALLDNLCFTGVEAVTIADMPGHGTGLGSSSALAVGLVAALSQFRGEDLDTLDILERAIALELDALNKPIGLQDQTRSALGSGGLLHWEKGLFRPSPFIMNVTPEILNGLVAHSMLIEIPQRNEGEGDEILARQRKDIRLNSNILSEMRDLAEDGHFLLCRGLFEELGETMLSSWLMKSKLAEGITNPLIDELIDTALGQGAWGAKVLGAGGGGFLYIICSPEKRMDILPNLKSVPFQPDYEGVKTIYNGNDIRMPQA